MSKKEERKPKPPHLPQETPEDGPDETKGQQVEHVTVFIDFDNSINSYTARKNGWEDTTLIPVTLESLETKKKVEMGFCLTQPGDKVILFDLESGINIGMTRYPEKDENFLDNLSGNLEQLIQGFLKHQLLFSLHAAMLTEKLEREHGPRPAVKQEIPKHLH